MVENKINIEKETPQRSLSFIPHAAESLNVAITIKSLIELMMHIHQSQSSYNISFKNNMDEI